ncbi:uncharacterized protein EI97DRAFT_382203 [Westerdykella ornata]|uniref:CST complex subunit STN1 n=1 Tax=Westerdykella ornata TaxID=318751 RepID=A0A6A6JBZ2_WESOR|nr:uncharacterized protein EI97DRAFT_382203 [Westerdykella ornata]KAF2274091.1 hypothetical protein EI97DRAFT_382203 [Westerdykella ornata]
MSTHISPNYKLYPAYCFRISPTYDAWVKMTAADVQALQTVPEFQGQRIYFHLNHPIRYICLVGLIVAIDDVNPRYTIFTLDDSSGVTIEVKIIRLRPDEYDPAQSPSNTMVENVNVYSGLGNFAVMVNGEEIDVGTVLKVKGTISEFRGNKQVELKRVWIVKTTDEEVKAWLETARFKKEVLDVPWHITKGEHRRIVVAEKYEKKKRAEKERLQREYEEKRMERKRRKEKEMAERERKLEIKRKQEEIIMNEGALI